MHDDHRPSPLLEDDLHAFVDDALDDARRRAVQAHLDTHPESADRVARLRAQRQRLRSAFASVADEPVPSRLNLRSIVEEHAMATRRTGQWRIAAAVVLALGLGGAGGWLARGSSGEASAGIASLSREANASYATYAFDAAHPVEIDGEHKAQLVSWVSTRLQRPVAVPDLQPAGYHLIGGRLVATEHGPAALFLYDDAAGARLAVLVRPMTIERDTPAMQRNDGPFGGWSWADKGLGYSIVGNGRGTDLHPLADDVRSQARASL